MNTIRFSHRYKKMPAFFLQTYIKDIAVVDYKDLTPEQIKLDTETTDGKFYNLPKTRLIWIKLWTGGTGGTEWATLRRYTKEKFEYYSGLVGREVHIEIVI